MKLFMLFIEYPWQKYEAHSWVAGCQGHNYVIIFLKYYIEK